MGSRASLSRPFWRGVRKHSAPRGMVRKANAEATFEKRPRKHAEVAQHRELLPTKEADGSLKRQRVKLTKKEIAKQRKAESGNDKGKKKKSEKKAEKLAATAGGKNQEDFGGGVA